jgi:aminoglycoside phosphotransferase
MTARRAAPPARVAAPDWVRVLHPGVVLVDILGTRDGAAHVVGLAGPGGVPLVLKRYDDGRGAHAVRTMRAVQRALEATGGSATLAVPTVHRWHAHAGVLAQAAVPGRPLLPLLATPRRRTALTHAARALAALHTSGARTGPVTAVADHLAELIHPRPEQMARAVPALGPRIRAVTAALRRWQAAAPPVEAVPIHRDAHPRQMALDGRRVWLVDWDLAARGDAALDVANFALYLRTRLAHDGHGAAEAFLAAYRAHGVDVADRLGVFTACMALRLVSKTWRLRPPGWQARMRAFLTLAEQAL